MNFPPEAAVALKGSAPPSPAGRSAVRTAHRTARTHADLVHARMSACMLHGSAMDACLHGTVSVTYMHACCTRHQRVPDGRGLVGCGRASTWGPQRQGGLPLPVCNSPRRQGPWGPQRKGQTRARAGCTFHHPPCMCMQPPHHACMHACPCTCRAAARCEPHAALAAAATAATPRRRARPPLGWGGC